VTTETKRRIVCWHEASHAAVAHRLALSIDRVEIRVVGELIGGAVIHDDEHNQRLGRSLRALVLEDLLWNHTIMSAAGPLGEMKLRLQERWPLDDAMRASHEDDRRSIGMIAAFTGQDPAGLQEAASRRARALLDNPAVWGDVSRLAEALDAHWPTGDGIGVMPGKEVEELLAAPAPA